MNRKSAMSNMGYAIVSVIVLGIIMIISAPMFVTSAKKEQPEPISNYEREEIRSDDSELRLLEERLTSRIDDLERRQSDARNNSSTSNKYVCSIEGKVDENGDVVPLDDSERGEKIVFVCEYRQ